MPAGYVRVPPDSTGKRVHHHEHAGEMFVQSVHVVDHDNPEQAMAVDSHGAAVVTFSEGQPTLDPVGQLRIAESVVLGAYDFVADSQDSLFWDETVGSGTVTYLAGQSMMLLSVGTASGDSAARITNRYHYYLPGTGIVLIMTLAIGDSGKPNSRRMWGLGDAENGVFFREENGVKSVVVRSNATGVVVENGIEQSNWNGDPVNGTGLSGFNLDTTKRNVYWLDFLWLGAGAVRFGILDGEGRRVICHTVSHTGGDPRPYMRMGSLPVMHKVQNMGVTGSTSEMRIICSAVYSESEAAYVYWRYSDMENSALKAVTANTPLLSVRSVLSLDGGVTKNRVGTYPDSLAIYVTGGDIKLDIHVDITAFTDASWALDGAGTLEGDEAATAFTPEDGSKMITFYLGVGSHNLDLKPYFETNDLAIYLKADGVTQGAFVVACTALTGSGTQARATLTYRELS